MERKDKLNQPINYKSSVCKSEFNEGSRTIEAYFNSWDFVDSHQDVSRKGAFLKSINERGPNNGANREIKWLLQHDIVKPSGVLKEMGEDSFGAKFVGEIEKTPEGDITLERYKNGFYKEHSFGFMYVDGKLDFVEDPKNIKNTELIGDGVWEVKEYNVFEVSTVTLGSNSETPLVGFKGLAKEDQEKMLMDEFRFLLKHSPNYEYELKLRQFYHKQISLLHNLTAKSIKNEITESRGEKETAKIIMLKSLI